MNSNFVDWNGLNAVDIMVEYTTEGSVQHETITYTVKEIEEDFNHMRGADNRLHPKWMDINPEVFDAFIGNVISNLSSRPFTLPLVVDPDETTPPRNVSVGLPHQIYSIIVFGVYEDDEQDG